jgi:hypothetical protein
MASLASQGISEESALTYSAPRTIFIFKAFVKVVSGKNYNFNEKQCCYSKMREFMGNLRRYDNPFHQGPRIVVYSKQNDRAVGILYVRGVPSSTKKFVEQECILLRPSKHTWQPLDVSDNGLYVKIDQVEIQEWYVYEKTLDASSAVVTTYNVAHLLGERKNMGHANNKQLNCFSKNIVEKKAFYNFHANALYNLQSDVILLQEMPGVYHNDDFTDDNILKPIVDEMNKMLELGQAEKNGIDDKNDNMETNILKYKFISLCQDNRYWHTYGIISRLQFTNFTQETPVTCQGICGITLKLLNGKNIRIYTSHLHYQPYINNYQAEEVQQHLRYIKSEALVVYHNSNIADDDNVSYTTTSSPSNLQLKYDYILWGGDFNNKSLLSYNMQTIIKYGKFKPQPYFYVDTFFVNSVKNILSSKVNDKRPQNPNYKLLKVGDHVLAKFPNYRSKNDHPYFFGTIKSFEINCESPLNGSCTVLYNDGDVAAGMKISELYYAPDCPHKDIGNNSSHRFTYIEDLLSSYNYNFDVYNVYSSFNNAEISEHRWYWDSANKFGVEIEKNKGRADDGWDNWNDNFKISYLGPVSKTFQKVFFYKHKFTIFVGLLT